MERLVSGDAPSLGASSVSAFHFGYPTTLAECRLEDRALSFPARRVADAEEEMGKQRSDGVELFRCLSMFVIVLYHTWCHGIFGPDNGMMNLQAWWTVFFCALLIWHVDGFVAISGWFGIRFSWRKLVTLYGVILFYSLLGIVLRRIVEPESFGLRSALTVHGSVARHLRDVLRVGARTSFHGDQPVRRRLVHVLRHGIRLSDCAHVP